MKDECTTLEVPLCQATRYWRNRESLFNKIRPYNRDNPHEWIFADGSKIRFSPAGEPEFMSPDHEVLNVEGEEAFKRGVRDRLARKRFDQEYKTRSHKFIPSIKYQYACGWFSVPEWPKKVTLSSCKI